VRGGDRDEICDLLEAPLRTDWHNTTRHLSAKPSLDREAAPSAARGLSF
jgi:hypothetical protein